MADAIHTFGPRRKKPSPTAVGDSGPVYRMAPPVRRMVSKTASPAVTGGGTPARVPAPPQAPPVRVPVPTLTTPNTRPPRIPGYFLSRRYKPEAVLGQGGRAAVYKAWDKVLGIHVVLKFLREGLAQTPEAAEEIRREAVVTMRLAHENIVRLHNVETLGTRMVLVMEYVDGENLRQILERLGPLSAATVLDIVSSCASALTYAHKIGIVHRDLKPENIMIGADSVLKLVDFGTALMERDPGEETYLEGTPGYMSPEQIRGGEPVDARTDIFALGAVTAELLTGKRVFLYDGDVQHLLKAEPQGLEGLSPAVRAVLTRAVAPNREDRWSSVNEFHQALAAAMEGDRTTS
jgi:serine/threonine-protein kinase